MTPKGEDWRDDPILGTTPAGRVSSLLSELLERVRAARQLPEAIEILKPLDSSVFERAWVNELFVILYGVKWTFDIVRIVQEREASSKKIEPELLPRSFRETEISAIETELKPARDKLVAHYFGNLRGDLTVRDFFSASVTRYTLKHGQAVIESSIDALWEWHQKNHTLVENYISADDLKGKRQAPS
jgi:hypothetical protein